MAEQSRGERAAARYVSTGSLPGREETLARLRAAHALALESSEGAVSQVYPALAAADPNWLGIALARNDGTVDELGDSRVGFPIMSVSKPFAFALMCEQFGVEVVRNLVGVNATGLPFNSLQAVDRAPDGRTNPMVNAGAIATTSLAPGADLASRWRFLHEGFARFAGHTLELDETVFTSASQTNFRNRSLAMLLADVGAIAGDPVEALDLYTRQCCLRVSAADLAVMGATLADGGVHPVTRERVVSQEVARVSLAVMSIAGMYETSGDWLLDVGAPGKSGISGAIVAVAPGKGALGIYSPPLDAAGNSVRGQLIARRLAGDLGLDPFVSQPAEP